MHSVILYTLYFIGRKKQAIDLAVKWYATESIEFKRSNAGSSFIAWQKKYPLCEYCTWPLYPSDEHEYCNEMLQEEADWRQFCTEEEAKMAEAAEQEEELERLRDEMDAAQDDPWVINDFDDADDIVSTSEVYSRAYRHFGNHEMAREATEMYPGDFI